MNLTSWDATRPTPVFECSVTRMRCSQVCSRSLPRASSMQSTTAKRNWPLVCWQLATCTTCWVSPALGRLLNPSDDAASAPPVAVLSHSYWQRRFGGDARVIGQILRLNTSAVTIVGVTAAAFRGITLGASPDITLALGSSAELFRGRGILENGGNWWLR